MPISRQKSCMHCRRAKARCNLANVCSRCIDRGLQCSYAPFSKTAVPVSRPEEPLLLLDEILDQDVDNHNSLRGDNGDMYAFNLTETAASEPSVFRVDGLGWPTPSWTGSNLTCSVPGGTAPITFNEVLEQPSRPQSSHLFPRERHQSDRQDFVSENNNGMVVILGNKYHDLLYPRNSKTTDSHLASRFIRGQVKAYPTLLLRGQLPPFIYPSCVLYDQLPQNCVQNGVHQCLTPPLAVCTSLVRIWEARTPATEDMVWRSIYAEAERLGREYRQFNSDELLGAFQSMAIYLLLQSQDLQNKQLDDLLSLGAVIMEIARFLFQSQSSSHLRNLLALPDLTQRVWTFNESIRRTMALLFMLDSLVREGSDEYRDPKRCGGTENTPLPGPRDLWDYHIRESWAFRLERVISSGGGLEPQLKLGDLRKADEGDQVLVDKLARWCEGTDDFGGLLRMSALLV
ncbi:uncharacterized protein BP5553_07604 [Venustampulla echinocandica]|uniref:Zn(2)-C6 fungal-type domain-containing protein n=1 Tax=Venustampulla echinocandica TaxID=2656787 RepID=A0A370TH00_9HELO|nr:uncharacterized protein BP5553_07604 [Venustampulla echinocandica]RDL34476.1 hypothetical protein BP5553_07604 [Venustampulla echinocandica]